MTEKLDPTRAFFLATASEHIAETFREISPVAQAAELNQALQDMDSANTPEHLVAYFQKRVDAAIARGEEPHPLDVQDLYNARIVLGAIEAGFQ